MSRLASMLIDGPSPVLRHVVLAALVALAAWLGVKLLIALVAPSSVYQPVLIAQSTADQPVAATRDYDFSYNPFAAGDAQGGVVEVEPEPGDDAPETTLNLQLKGLRSGENGTAFIRTPDGQEDNYYIGDTLMPGVNLRGVFPTFVLIDVNGQRQRLTTDDAKAARTAGRTGSVANGPSARPSSLQTLRSADAMTLLSQVSLSPAFDADGTRIGSAVQPRSAAVDLETYGFRAGDIVTRFAGQDVSAGLPDIGALRRVAGSGRPISVDILRDGQPMTITIGSSS